jgi:hypothetical protein
MGMDRDAWNSAYATRIQEQSGADADEKFAVECAEQANDAFNNGDDPVEAADEEMSNWDNDGDDNE